MCICKHKTIRILMHVYILLDYKYEGQSINKGNPFDLGGTYYIFEGQFINKRNSLKKEKKIIIFVKYPIYPTPPLGQDMTQGQFFFFKQSLTGFL